MVLKVLCVLDLSGDQRGEQHQPGAAQEIQAGDEPEEEVPQRAGPPQRSDPQMTVVYIKKNFIKNIIQNKTKLMSAFHRQHPGLLPGPTRQSGGAGLC